MTAEEQGPASPSRQSFRAYFISGLALGLGFSAIFVPSFWAGMAALAFTVKPPSDSSDGARLFKQYGPSAGLAIDSQQPTRTRSNLSVLGVVRNDGTDPWQYIRFQVNLFGAEEQLLGLCEGAAFAPLFPGQKRPFQIDCRGSDDHPLPDYRTYAIEIVDASYVYGGGK